MRSGCLPGLAAALLVCCPGWVAGQGDQGPSVEQLMARLADPDFKTRQQAQVELVELGKEDPDPAIARFYAAYENHADPEVRSRARSILRELVIYKQSGEGKGYLGIRMQADELMQEDGTVVPVVRVTDVMEGTPAEKAGLKPGDLIRGIDDFKVREGDALDAFGLYVQNCKPRTDVNLHILRSGEKKDIVVNLMRRPPDLEQRTFLWGGEEYVPPTQEEMEEKEFQDWLRNQRRDEDRKN